MLGRLGVALVLLAAVVGGVAGRATAEIYTCSGSESHYFDLAYTSTSSIIGTSAGIVNHFGGVCDTDTSQGNFSAAYSMVAGAAAHQYAQAGFVRWYNSPDYFFAQDNDGFGDVQTTYGSSPAYGQSHHYWVQWVSSCSCLRQNVDSTVFQATPFDPYATWSEPFSNQWSGEVAYLQSDMPGNPTDGYTNFSGMQVQQSSTGSWSNSLPTTYYADQNSSRWTYTTVQSNAFSIWTYYEYSP